MNLIIGSFTALFSPLWNLVSSNGNNAHLIELAQSADIRQVAFEICARLVSEGHTVLLPSESGSVYSDLAGQQNKLFALIIEQKSNIPVTSGIYLAQLNRSINEAILHKKFSFPNSFVQHIPVPVIKDGIPGFQRVPLQ